VFENKENENKILNEKELKNSEIECIP